MMYSPYDGSLRFDFDHMDTNASKYAVVKHILYIDVLAGEPISRSGVYSVDR